MNKIKKPIKETIIEALAIMLLCTIFVVILFFAGYLMKIGINIESEMPSMKNEIGFCEKAQ